MSGRIKIDNRNFDDVVLLDGSMDSLLCFPPVKGSSVITNNWHESSGVEVDVSGLRLDKRDIRITLFLRNGIDTYYELCNLLLSTTYHTFYFEDLDRYYVLRVVNISEYQNGYGNKGFLVLQLADDAVCSGVDTPTFDVDHDGISSKYTIDDIPFEAMGLRVLKGTRESLIRYGKIKDSLSRNISVSDSVEYVNEHLQTEWNNINMNLLLTAEDMTEFHTKWDKVLALLSQRKAFRIGVDDMGVFEAVYQSCRVNEFIMGVGKVWLSFSLTFIVVSKNTSIVYVDSDGNLTAQYYNEEPDISAKVYNMEVLIDGEDADYYGFSLEGGSLYSNN